MKNKEQLHLQEAGRTNELATNPASSTISTRQIEEVTQVRASLLATIQEQLSPLMRRALTIKLEREEAYLQQLIPTTINSSIKEEPPRILDPRYFRKRRLPKRPS